MVEEFNPIGEEEFAAAHKLVDALCARGDRAWTMSIPVQPMDSDMLLNRIIERCKFLERDLAKWMEKTDG